MSDLRNLIALALNWNDLTGPIPLELGYLNNLSHLSLFGNRLTGPVPRSLGFLGNLNTLYLFASDLSGRLPRDLTLLRLHQFAWHHTDLCAPADEEFQAWLKSIPHNTGNRNCSS